MDGFGLIIKSACSASEAYMKPYQSRHTVGGKDKGQG